MINLIPPAAKRTMKREYWLRVGVVWSLLLMGVLIVAMVLLVPSFVLVNVQLQAYQTQLQNATEAAANQKALTKEVKSANQEAQTVYAFGTVDPFSRYVRRVQDLQSSDITIRQFDVVRDGTTVESITITGTAATRNSLTAFSAALNSDPFFSEANIPLSNLAANEDIGFTITIMVADPDTV